MHKIAIKSKTPKPTLERREVEPNGSVALKESSDVHVDVDAKLVREYLREGVDLVLVQHDGESLRIGNFFAAGEGGDSRLYLQGDGGAAVWVELTALEEGCPLVASAAQTCATPFDGAEASSSNGDDDNDRGALFWLAGGLAAAAGAALGRGGDSSALPAAPAGGNTSTTGAGAGTPPGDGSVTPPAIG